MRKLNNFFFPIEENEELHPSDVLWFYGSYAAWAVIVGFLLLSVY